MLCLNSKLGSSKRCCMCLQRCLSSPLQMLGPLGFQGKFATTPQQKKWPKASCNCKENVSARCTMTKATTAACETHCQSPITETRKEEEKSKEPQKRRVSPRFCQHEGRLHERHLPAHKIPTSFVVKNAVQTSKAAVCRWMQNVAYFEQAANVGGLASYSFASESPVL